MWHLVFVGTVLNFLWRWPANFTNKLKAIIGAIYNVFPEFEEHMLVADSNNNNTNNTTNNNKKKLGEDVTHIV